MRPVISFGETRGRTSELYVDDTSKFREECSRLREENEQLRTKVMSMQNE
jgi:hypothetical protein